ncbi:sensor histidine kinase [Saccharibacillus alkalitolerans]|uniref:histidine kinase n=1 Tax=Saccharibacillus alkalitolerans TaxID=2705290 RepID=A0ABX0FBK2_9BACL|nr:HAMP domain-containing sensor histidine kinase [Saccharibacillus alkalitolerans]NGZ77780.1 two-component sensor histidine kinase [Saccharibacillus alkalitolerans]
MKKAGITTKLFVATAAFFILFYFIVLSGQLIVFPNFYEQRKFKKLEQEAAALASIYRSDPEAIWEDSSPSILRLYKDGANFALTDFRGNLRTSDPYRMEVERSDGRTIDVSLYYLANAFRPEFSRLRLSPGQQVTMRGVYGDDTERNVFYPHYLQKAEGASIGEAGDGTDDGSEIQEAAGTIKRISMPDASKASRRSGLLYLAMDEFFPLSAEHTERLKNMEPVEQEWVDPWSESRSLIMIQPVRRGDGEIKLLFLVTSMQELKETNSALRVFYAYLGAGGLVLILLLSKFYSHLVTRPLLLLNKRAEKMKNLDFSWGEPIPRKDELGSLSHTLVELSGKLGRTLDELNDTNERLRSEIEQNKELEQLQKDFFANASHELKTPISVVRGFAEGMRDGISTGRQDHYIGVILEQSEKMERLVQDMLDLLHLESPAVKLYKSPVLLSELTEDVLDNLVYQMEEKKVTASIDCFEERPVMADAGRMEQVVLNLMTNAIRHAKEGSVIEISVRGGAEDCSYVVHNKGEAIPEEYQKRIWERFVRVEASRNRKSGGTGLGLAIVKRILELHGCAYRVENRDGGVTFTLLFPS